MIDRGLVNGFNIVEGRDVDYAMLREQNMDARVECEWLRIYEGWVAWCLGHRIITLLAAARAGSQSAGDNPSPNRQGKDSSAQRAGTTARSATHCRHSS